MYTVHQESGANQGETPGIGESPSSQPISGPVIFSKRQALSRAVVVNSNMSRGKYLAREGLGSRLGTPAKELPLFYPLGRFERLKTVLMGTNIPHACIPGLVWQKRARRFPQFELKVGELGFPIHFVCVSAALYHRGHAAAIFSP